MKGWSATDYIQLSGIVIAGTIVFALAVDLLSAYLGQEVRVAVHRAFAQRDALERATDEAFGRVGE
jgi:hypothetical protein